jgi:hypothetical protein
MWMRPFPNGQRAALSLPMAPRKSNWGYGAELADPDGYFVRLWDERTMKEK